MAKIGYLDKRWPATIMAAIAELDLTEGERMALAYAARKQGEGAADWPEPSARDEHRARWRKIADALHPDPLANGS